MFTGYVGILSVSAMHWQHPMCMTNDFSPLTTDCLHALTDEVHYLDENNGILRAWHYQSALCSRHFSQHGFWTWVIHGTCRIDVYDAYGQAPCVYTRSLREAIESIIYTCSYDGLVEGRKELPMGPEGFFREVRVTYNSEGLAEPPKRWEINRLSN
jgi:hypothetical protein